MFDFDRVIDRRATASVKWDKYGGADVLPLWVAELDFTSPPAVIDALKVRVDHGIFGYTHPPSELVEEVRRMLEVKYRWPVEPEWIVWLPGLVAGLNVTCRAVGGDGDAVITTVPVYPPFLTAPELSRRRKITIPMVCIYDHWQFDRHAFEQALTPDTRLFLFCHPYNPLGRAFGRSELEEIAEICLRHDIVICSDEIHCDLILDPTRVHIPTASLHSEIADRTITLMAPSKTFNIPGLGCSFAVISNANLRKRFKQAMEGIVPHVNLLGFTAALAAYRHGEPWRLALLEYLRENKAQVMASVGRMPGLKTTEVEATFLAWIDARDTGIQQPAKFFEKAGVGLSDGAEFGGAGFVRLNFGCPRLILDEALNRMETALRRHAKTGV
ncbi:MAG TPA: MalY/PatB family protein [Desulfobacterales bacterium]